MSLKPGDRKNFDTLKRAFGNGDVALMECTDAKTGEYVAVVCAVTRTDEEVVMAPLAKLFGGNSYEEVIPLK